MTEQPQQPTPQFRGPSPRGSMLLAGFGIAIATALGVLVNPRAGALVVAATLAAAGVWRAAKPRTPFAAGFAVRSKGLDLFVYFAGAIVIAILALTVPLAY